MSSLAETFWEGCAAGEIRYQRCTVCDRAQFYPRPFCARDGGAVEWAVSAGLGTVYAATLVHRPPAPEFKALVPYAILLVEMDEGFRLMAHGAPSLAVGDRVRAGFRPHQGQPLPYFSPA